MIRHLQQRETTGEIALYYFDATGFCLDPCIPYAWQPIGDIIQVPASKGERFNVVGFLNRHTELLPFLVEGKVDTTIVVACFEHLSRQLRKKTVVLLDNAPVQKSKAFIQQLPHWIKRGLLVKYLPPYSPELNLMEILWRCIKYYWLPFSAYASFQCLLQAVEHILRSFGSEYTISFQVN